MHYRDMTREERLKKSARLQQAMLEEDGRNARAQEGPRECDAFFSYTIWVSQMMNS